MKYEKRNNAKLNYSMCSCLALLRWFFCWYPFHNFGKQKNYSVFFNCGTERWRLCNILHILDPTWVSLVAHVAFPP